MFCLDIKRFWFAPHLASLLLSKRFGDNVEYVHCINMLPFTPITEELLHRDFMEQEWPVLETAFDGRDPGTRRVHTYVPYFCSITNVYVLLWRITARTTYSWGLTRGSFGACRFDRQRRFCLVVVLHAVSVAFVFAATVSRFRGDHHGIAV